MICTLLTSTSPGARANTTPEEIDRRSESTSQGCSRTPINPRDDLDAVVNVNPLGTVTTSCLELKAATYLVDETVVLRQGDKLVGPAGKVSTRGSAPDADGDGIPDVPDNCLRVANLGQKDLDGDSMGDVCDSDRDGDGGLNRTDYAPDDPTIQDPPWCPATGTHIFPGDDLDAAINGSNTTFCVHPGTYPIDNIVTVAQGDNIYAEPGVERDIVLPSGKVVHDRTAAVKLTNAGNLNRMVNVTADSATIDWLGGGGAVSTYLDPTSPDCLYVSPATGKCPKVGTGTFIGGGRSGPGVTLSRLDISGNAANCIEGFKGVLVDSELSNCSTDPTYDEFASAAVKTIYESEYARNYIHDTGSSGLWCDQGCHDVAEHTNGFWVHDNLVVRVGGWGIFYEFSPMVDQGVHLSSPSALVERNYVAEAGSGAMHMSDSQNGMFRNNSVGPQTIGGISYGADGNAGLGLLFSDSSRDTDLWNGDAVRNNMHGERILGCELPDNVVYCHDDNVGRGFPWLRTASIAVLAATAILYTLHRIRFLITSARVTPAGRESESGNIQEEDK
jgi:hypothetical protein